MPSAWAKQTKKQHAKDKAKHRVEVSARRSRSGRALFRGWGKQEKPRKR